MTDREAEEILDKFDKEHPVIYRLASIGFILVLVATLVGVFILLWRMAKILAERLLS